MSVSRRRFLLLTVLGGLWVSVTRLFAARSTGVDPLEARLCGWLDTLLPRDGESPAASELQVPQQILNKAASIPEYHQLLQAGLRWADAQAVVSGVSTFAELDELGRETVVAQAEAQGVQSMPGLFFYHTLKDARQFYYQDGASWAGVGFPHAPQPYGFTDYMEAPQ